MRFLIDENCPLRVRVDLERRGYEVLDVRGTPLEGSPDTSLTEHAIREQAIVVTTDRDFFHTIPLQYPSHPGTVVIALRQPNAAAIAAALARAMPTIEAASMQCKSILITDTTVYIRRPTQR